MDTSENTDNVKVYRILVPVNDSELNAHRMHLRVPDKDLTTNHCALVHSVTQK